MRFLHKSRWYQFHMGQAIIKKFNKSINPSINIPKCKKTTRLSRVYLMWDFRKFKTCTVNFFLEEIFHFLWEEIWLFLFELHKKQTSWPRFLHLLWHVRHTLDTNVLGTNNAIEGWHQTLPLLVIFLNLFFI